MIFSLFKGFFIIIFAGILGVIAGYLNDLPGGINLVLNAQEFRFSFLTATLIILILIAIIFLGVKPGIILDISIVSSEYMINIVSGEYK